jgi:hypothetical protein
MPYQQSIFQGSYLKMFDFMSKTARIVRHVNVQAPNSAPEPNQFQTIRALSKQIVAMAATRKISVKLFSKGEAHGPFLSTVRGQNTPLLKLSPSSFLKNSTPVCRLNAVRG